MLDSLLGKMALLPVTLGFAGLSIGAYFFFGAGPFDFAPVSQTGHFFEACLNTFRHGNLNHLLSNVVILVLGGQRVEKELGSTRMFIMAAGAIFLGTGLELAFVNANFLGLSGVAYCFALSAIMLRAHFIGMGLFFLAALVLVGVEIRFMSDNVAVFVHLGGVVFGGGSIVFNKLFGQKSSRPVDPEQPFIEPLKPEHIDRVVEIINETDDDDAADADETLRERGCGGMYALWHQNRIIGVTGYSPTEVSNDTVWLSWTYLERAARGRALGRFMIDELLLILNQKKIRKIFISTSDYKEDGEDVYGAARKFYEGLGAKLEVTIPGFYSADESKLIYGLENPGMGKSEDLSDLGDRGVIFTDIQLDEDSDDVGAICWEETEHGVKDIDIVLGLANTRQFRLCVLALPADISDVATSKLELKGLKRLGILQDYYALGLGQVWWRFSLT